MANFDMVPPDANELFGFNELPDARPSVVNWKVVSIVVIVFTLGVIIGNELKANDRQRQYLKVLKKQPKVRD